MANQNYKMIEIIGTSDKSIEDAVNGAISKAGKTVRKMRWFQITDIRGDIDRNKVAHWQTSLKVGFHIED
ncbi:MAG: dodecin domain-containing protein [Candidatus Omnitrophica bacterium]|nr:dodecin domain-containing protein [Candidatus Omnitrophota bacterium]